MTRSARIQYSSVTLIIISLCLVALFPVHEAISDCEPRHPLFDYKPKAFPLRHDCITPDRQKPKGGSIVFSLSSTNHPSSPIIQSMENSNGVFVSVLNAAGDLINEPRMPVKVADDYTGSGISTGDLNSDGREDYILDLWSDGYGLASGFCNVVFVLSVPENNAYAITTVTSLFSGDEDFVDINNDGQCEFILRDFLSDNVTSMGADYFVYQLLSVDGAQVKLANEIDERFPMFFLDTVDSGQITEALTEEQKAQMVKRVSDPFWSRK